MTSIWAMCFLLSNRGQQRHPLYELPLRTVNPAKNKKPRRSSGATRLQLAETGALVRHLPSQSTITPQVSYVCCSPRFSYDIPQTQRTMFEVTQPTQQLPGLQWYSCLSFRSQRNSQFGNLVCRLIRSAFLWVCGRGSPDVTSVRLLTFCHCCIPEQL